jgi:spore coat polysaccharide biosynthesis protein SpsF
MATSKRIGIITQARMTSTRLPGKVMLQVNGRPMLDYHIERLLKSDLPVFLATTVNTTDDVIAEFARNKGIAFHRGDEHNVLSRYFECAEKNSLDVIVRVTSDCPLIDGEFVRESVEEYLLKNDPHLYASNCLQRTYPDGLDFEIFSMELLREAYENATAKEDLEHVTPYIYKNKGGNTRFLSISQDIDRSSYRITLDTKNDFELISQLIENYHADTMSHREITSLLDAHPELVQIAFMDSL